MVDPIPEKSEEFPASQNGIGRKNVSDIEAIRTDIIVTEVERLLSASNPDPQEFDKAKKMLQVRRITCYLMAKPQTKIKEGGINRMAKILIWLPKERKASCVMRWSQKVSHKATSMMGMMTFFFSFLIDKHVLYLGLFRLCIGSASTKVSFFVFG